MNKIVRRVFVAAILLLLSGGGSCYVGVLQFQNEREQFKKYEEASGVWMSDSEFDRTNNWQVLGFLLCFVGIGVLFAAGLMLEQDQNTGAS